MAEVICPECGNSFEPPAGAVRVTESWDEQAHPRATAGTATGGQWAGGGGASKSKAPAQKGKATPAKAKPRAAGRGPLGYNGKTGTGYGRKGGDPRVRSLQAALNRLGLTDSKGKKLVVDGQFGPLTTSAVKKAQRQLGLRADGRVTPALLRKLASAKKLERPKPATKTKAKTVVKRATVKPTPKAVPKMTTISRREAVEAMVNGAMSFDDIREAVRKALSQRAREESTDDYGPWVMVADLTDTDVVYAAGSDELYQCSYSITEGGEVTLGDPEKVVRTYAPEPAAADDESASGTVTEASDRIYGRVIEAKADAADGGRVFRVRIIAYGDSKNGRRYSESVMSKAAHLYEGARAYDHHRSDEEMRSSTINGMVGSYRSVEAEGDGVYADLHLLPSAAHAAEALDATIAAQAEGLPPLLGVSHDVMGHYKPVVTGGRRLQEATAIVKVNSADLVADPAAGGQATRMVAGGTDGTGTEPAEEKEGTVPTKEEILAAFAEASDEELEAVGLARASEAIDEGEQDEQERETEAAQPKTGWLAKAMIRQKVTDAGLPAPVVESLTAELPDRVTESDVDARIASLKSMYGIVERSGLVPTAGNVTVTQEAIDKKKGALDAFFAGRFSEGYHSFRQAFTDFTGRGPRAWDEDFNRTILRECFGAGFDAGDRATESMDSSSWAQVLGDSVTRRMVAMYQVPNLQSWRQITSSIVPVNDFRTQRVGRVGGYGTLPVVNEGAPYQPLTSPGDEEATYAITKKGGTEDLTLEMIANDDVRAIAGIPNKLGRAAAQTLYRFVWDFLRTNATATYDSTALFHANHANTANPAVLSETSLSAGRVAMEQQVAFGDSSEILSLTPNYLVVPSNLETLAFKLCTSAVAVTSAEDGTTPNIHQGTTPIRIDYFTDSNDWFLVADPALCPTLEIGFYLGRQDPELFTQADANVGSVFSADTYTYKIRHIYSGTILDHRGFYRGANN